MFAAAIAIIAASAAATAMPSQPESANKMGAARIREHNAGLDPAHPHRETAAAGSRASLEVPG